MSTASAATKPTTMATARWSPRTESGLGSSGGSLMGGGGGWMDILETVGEVGGLVGGAVTDYMAEDTRTRASEAYLNIEADIEMMNALLAEQEAELFGFQGDIIETQHLINRNQIRDKYIREAAKARAKYGASGIDIGSESVMAVAADIFDQMDKEIDIDQTNERLRLFNEVTMPKTRAKAKAGYYRFRSAAKRSMTGYYSGARKLSLMSGITNLSQKVAERYGER